MLRAGSFQIFRRRFLYFAVLLTFFFLHAKSFFHLLQFFRFQSLSFVFSGSAFVHVRVTHRFHQFAAHGDHLFSGLAEDFFFQLFKLAYVSIFFKARDLAFLFFNLFFFHYAARLLRLILIGTGCRRPCLLLLRRWFKRGIQMGGCFGLVFIIQLNGFFHFNRAGTKDAGHVHALKAMLVRLGSRRLIVLKSDHRWIYDFGHGWRWLSAMENRWRFHTRLRFLRLEMLFMLAGDGAGGFSVLQKSALLGFSNGRLRCRGLRSVADWLRPLAVFGQRFTRKHHGTGGKCRWIEPVFSGRLRPGCGFRFYRGLRRRGRRCRLRLVFGNRFAGQQNRFRPLFEPCSDLSS